MNTGPPLHSYTVQYKDEDWVVREYCCYASGPMAAQIDAIEMVEHLHNHPHSILRILREDTPHNF